MLGVLMRLGISSTTELSPSLSQTPKGSSCSITPPLSSVSESLPKESFTLIRVVHGVKLFIRLFIVCCIKRFVV